MESWRKVWRDGIQPQVSTAGLSALFSGLRDNDERITQGATTAPPPMQALLDRPCEGADAIGYIAWKAYGADTVGKVEEFFANVCFDADEKLGQPASVRYFLGWFDETPRDVMRTDLMEEITRELAIRQCAEPVTPIDAILERTIV